MLTLISYHQISQFISKIRGTGICRQSMEYRLYNWDTDIQSQIWGRATVKEIR